MIGDHRALGKREPFGGSITTPQARARFSEELIAAVSELVRRHHDDSAPGGRLHRLVIVAHPAPGDPSAQEAS
ncbi:MAG: hypothetical protein F4151_08975 [Gammaproteobacteria bacterium]|nr:hypothetical protein [Gammaproteobacteria bacterium]